MFPYFTEFIGAIFFMYVVLVTNNPLAIGGALALVRLVAQPVSGGHINPAVSIAMTSAGKLPIQELLPYCVSQILGALVALEIFKRQDLSMD